MRNTKIEALKDAIRNPYAWPGGYAKRIVLEDGELLCQECAKKEFRLLVDSTKHHNRDGWGVMGVDCYWEGPTLQCAHCNTDIESEYGDPENDD